MSVDAVTLSKAREAYFTHDQAPPPEVVRPVIFESWRRTRLHGVTPEAATPTPAEHRHVDGQLLTAARAVSNHHRDILNDLACAVILTDLDGCILHDWVKSARLERSLERANLVPGFRIAEQNVGTGGSTIALETGTPVIVVGGEHYAEYAIGMGTASAPIRHPLTGQVMGTLGLTCRSERSSPFMLRWVEDQARLIEQALLDQVAAPERALIERFLSADRNSKQPVFCVNDRMVISNVAGTRLMGEIDQSTLWELASRSAQEGRGAVELTVPILDGDVNVTCEPVKRSGVHIGAVLRLAGDPSRSARPERMREDPRRIVSGLVGRSASWVSFCRELGSAVAADEPLLIVGEPGTGKSAVVAELIADDPLAVTVDLRDQAGATEADCLRMLRPEGAVAPRTVVLEHWESVDPQSQLRLRAAFAALPVTPRVLATSTEPGFDAEVDTMRDPVGEWRGQVVVVPPLRERTGDLPDLLDALSRRRAGAQNRQLWTSAAVQVVGRVAWPQNVASLATLVARVHASHRGRWVTPEVLPNDVRSMAARRSLSGLEQVEVHAILHALKAADGNKKAAAESLGIARSTLYRKVRALGIDLASAMY